MPPSLYRCPKCSPWNRARYRRSTCLCLHLPTHTGFRPAQPSTLLHPRAFPARWWLHSQPDASRFDAFVRSARYGCIPQASDWARFKAGYGWTPHRLAINSDGEIVTAASLLKHRDSGSKEAFLYCPRGPVLDWDGDGMAFAAPLSAIKQLARERNAHVLRIGPEVELKKAADLLAEHGFSLSPSGSFGGTQP